MASGSQLRAFALLGDSNIHPHINKTSCRAHPSLKSAQVLACGHLGIFQGTLDKIKPNVNVCIIACLTNFLTRADGHSTVALRVEPVLQEIRAALVEFCAILPSRLVLISPPMYRTTPLWYREGLAEILTVFSQVFNVDKPDNLILLPSFSTPSFEADGVHLTAYSGLEFIMHLFDSSQEALDNLSLALPAIAQKLTEANRVLEDRVMVLEQDHRRLGNVVTSKTAADAELFDFR